MITFDHKDAKSTSTLRKLLKVVSPTGDIPALATPAAQPAGAGASVLAPTWACASALRTCGANCGTRTVVETTEQYV